jgi:hypothetical protein
LCTVNVRDSRKGNHFFSRQSPRTTTIHYYRRHLDSPQLLRHRPTNTNIQSAPAHPSAASNSNSPAIQDPAHQLGCRKYLGSLAQAEVQLNSVSDYRSGKAYTKTSKTSTCEYHSVRRRWNFRPAKTRTEFSASSSRQPLATRDGPVAIANDGSQRLPDASDGGTAADEPPTADLWRLHGEWDAKYGHGRLIATAIRGWITDG